VPGNHDEVGHNWELSKSSALAHIFRRSKVIHELTEWNHEDCFIKGMAYYHGIEEDLRQPIINDESKLKILVPHAMISKKPLHPAINHVLIQDINTNFDWILCSHLHDNWGVEECNGTKYVNMGAIGRTSIPERDKMPRVAVCDTEAETIEPVELKCAKNGEEVFNIKAYEEIKGTRKDIESFIKSLEDVKFKSTNLRDKIDQICKTKKISKEIKEYLLNKLQEIES
jgi:DNA repair exonuclease SbcCD nuclease subunit